MTDSLNPADIKAAAGKVDEACLHYHACAGGLSEVEYEVYRESPLTGGYGETGAYMEALRDFESAFDNALTFFVDSELKFVDFLEGFRDRINQAASMYEANEARSEERLSRIAGQLHDGGV